MQRTDVNDITWNALTNAGLDIQAITRNQPNGYDEYTLTVGALRVVFGECPDVENLCADGEHPGWAYTSYERDGDGEHQDATEYFEAERLAEMLTEIRDLAKPYVVQSVVDQLNAYQGDNIWEDVIYGLDYDEAATRLVSGPGDEDVVIGWTHYRVKQGVWSAVGEFGTRVAYSEQGEIRVVGGGFDAHLGFYDCDGGEFGDDWTTGMAWSWAPVSDS